MQRWHAFARYAESLRQQGLDSKADAVLDQEIKDLTTDGADQVLVSQVRHEWAEIWDADAKADAERAGRN